VAVAPVAATPIHQQGARMSLAWPTKDPDEDKDYEVDWSDRILNDVIVESEFDVPAGLTKGITSFTASTTTVWLSEGAEGTTYSVVNRIRTEAGRREVQSVKLKIQAK
jgi:hypothetical protein